MTDIEMQILANQAAIMTALTTTTSTEKAVKNLCGACMKTIELLTEAAVREEPAQEAVEIGKKEGET